MRSWVAPASACACIVVSFTVVLGGSPGSASGGPRQATHGHANEGAAEAIATPMVHQVSLARPADRRCSRVAAPRRQARCEDSLLPPSHAAMDMGKPDYGGGAVPRGLRRSLDALTGPRGVPSRVLTITAAMGTLEVGGVTRPAMTFNGTTPGPTLRVRQGELVEVRLRNQDIRRGVTIHWHGVDVPGREDGVAGVTQNAVLPGEEYVYRFSPPDAGTFWYHSHQDSLRQVRMGLVGAIVVEPAAPADPPAGTDVTSVIHTYGPTLTLDGRTGQVPVSVDAGTSVRVRLVNSDSGAAFVSASSPFLLVAIDGFDIDDPTPLADTAVEIPAGGRVDLAFTPTEEPVRVGVLGGPSFVIGPLGGPDPPALTAGTLFDPLTYGRPGGSTAARSEFGSIDRDFDYRVGQRFGFLDGRYGNWFTINGRMIPDVPMFVVGEGDVVRVRIANTSAAAHPMHLHGHHALVLARNGQPATGAAWWVDSLEVQPGESYELAFVADNPGVWMFHCHNLPHARAGLVTHLMYAGVTSPYAIGRVTSRLANQPE